MLRRLGAVIASAVLLVASVQADEARLSFGGDEYSAGQSARIAAPVANDAFVAGYDASIGAPVAGDAHLGGFNVTVSAPITGNVYAAGYSISLTDRVDKDVTAFGNVVTLGASAAIGGNLRAAGATVGINAPVSGSVLAAGQTVTLDAAVAGDFSFTGETLSFGPNARIAGRVILQAPKPIDVPASVAPGDRVSYTELTTPDYATETTRTAMHSVEGFGPGLWGAVTWGLLLLVIGVGAITLLPRPVAALEAASTRGVWRLLGLGLVGFATTLGLVPALAFTVIGLVLLPFALLFAAIACGLAYMGGAYLAGRRLAAGFMPTDTNPRRLLVLVVSIVVAALLGGIPMLGWLIGMLLLLYGFGAATSAILNRPKATPAPLAPAAP